MVQSDLKCLRWLNANEEKLEKFAGQWIAFLEKRGVISSGATLEEALRKAKARAEGESPYMFKVPSNEELEELDITNQVGRRTEGALNRR
jgi:hypothetical protein